MRGIRKGSKWIRSPAMRGQRRWPSLHGRAIGGRRKENAGGKERKLGEEERKEGKGADRWGRSAAREKERGRATRWLRVMKAERWAELAGTWPRAAGKAEQAEAPNWATCGAVAGRPPGQAAEAGQRGKKKRKRGWAGSVGPKWKKMNFSKSNHFPNLFPLFLRFKSNSNVI